MEPSKCLTDPILREDENNGLNNQKRYNEMEAVLMSSPILLVFAQVN